MSQAGSINSEGGGGGASVFKGDTGTANPAAGVLKIDSSIATGGEANNITTAASGNTVSVSLNNSISQPLTNSSGTAGVYSLGGETFMMAPGEDNTFLGQEAGNLTLSGIYNVGIGSNALSSITSGSFNIAIGSNAESGISIGTDNVAIGLNSLVSSVGQNASYNIAIGNATLPNATGTQGSTVIGWHSGSNITSGDSNIVLGQQSLQNLTSGGFNIAIGFPGGNSYTSSESSNIVIANAGVVGENNTIRIGTQGTAAYQQNACYIAGIEGVTVANPNLVTINTSTGQLGSQSITGLTTWSVITSSQTAVSGKGYFCNNTSTLSLALPTTSAVGDVIEVVSINSGSVVITQGSGQQISYVGTTTTLGATGTLTSIGTAAASIKLVCSSANTVWQAVSYVRGWTTF